MSEVQPSHASFRLPPGAVRALVHAWLILDFFGDSRRTGQPSSTLTTTIFGQAFLALIVAALLFPDTPPVAFAAANLSVSTVFVAIGHLSDDRAAPRLRADQALVLPAPLRRHRLLLARALYASFYVGLLTVGMALPPAILLAFLPGQGVGIVPAYLALACLCAGAFTALLALALRAAERLLGTLRAQLFAGSLKALLLLVGLVAFATGARHLEGTIADLPFPTALVQAWPPYWAARALGGDLGRLLLLAGTLLAAALALLPFREVTDVASARVRPGRTLEALLAHFTPRQDVRGVAAFTAALLYRSARFRGKVLPLFGLPVGMWLLAFTSRDPAAAGRLLAVALQLPAVYLPFLLAFLGGGDAPRARWVFASAPGQPPAVLRHGVWVALTTHVLVPAHAVLLVVGALAHGPLRALIGSCFALGVAVHVARLALRRWDEVPFSSEVDAEEGLEFGRLITTALALTLLGLGFSLLPLPAAAAVAAAAAGTAYFTLRRLA